MSLRAVLALFSLGVVCMAADQGDGLKLALAAKPAINLSVYLDSVLLRTLTVEQVKTDAELILRQNNISINSKDDGDATLFISARAAPLTLSKATIYAVLPAIEYLERVTPSAAIVKCAIDNINSVRETIGCTDYHTIPVALWHKDSVMQIGDERLPDLREKLKDLVKQFVVEYLRANDQAK